jgi:hypothetical protein
MSSPRQSKAKRHHYLPEMIQRNFAGPDLHLWSYDRRKASYGVERKPIARLFREWHLYTQVAADGTRDTTTETRLSVIEKRAGQIIDRIIARARQGASPELADIERSALCDLFIAQFRRSPDIVRSAVARQDIDGEVAAGAAKWEAAGRMLSDEERADMDSGRLAARLRQNLVAGTAADPLAYSGPVMMQRGFSVGVSSNSDRTFILGSNPFVRLLSPTGRQDLGDPNTELWFPIAPDVALCSYGPAGHEQVSPISPEGVGVINTEIARQSTVIASGSRDLILALIEPTDGRTQKAVV